LTTLFLPALTLTTVLAALLLTALTLTATVLATVLASLLLAAAVLAALLLTALLLSTRVAAVVPSPCSAELAEVAVAVGVGAADLGAGMESPICGLRGASGWAACGGTSERAAAEFVASGGFDSVSDMGHSSHGANALTGGDGFGRITESCA
jgi:hypothetical protein